MKRTRTTWGAAAISIGALLLIGAPGAAAKTYKPNKTSDHTPNGCTKSDCTLREAVIAANDHSGADKIVLRPGKVYKRSSIGTEENASADGDLDVLDALRIETPGFVHTRHGRRPAKRAAIDGHHDERVIDAYASLTLSRVVIQNGHTAGAGGGIYTNELLRVLSSAILKNTADGSGAAIYFNTGTESKKLVMSDTLVKGNTAADQSGGLYGDGPMKISDSVFENNKSTGSDTGAIHTHYDTELIRTTIRGNSAIQGGGGIYNHGGELTVRNSTISGNYTVGASAPGGGIFSEYPMTITNSTIANNGAVESGGGVYAVGGTVTMNAVTITHNEADTGNNIAHGGGIYAYGVTPVVKNSIIAANMVGGSSDIPDCFGAFDSGGHNLIGIVTLGCTGFISSGDLIGGPLKLGPLKSNGGPTKTVALLKGSRAINHGGGDAPAKDQRGKRKRGPRDIGAFEYRGR